MSPLMPAEIIARLRPDLTHGRGGGRERRERLRGRHPQRRDGHHAAQDQALLGGDRRRELRDLRRRGTGAAAARVGIQAHLDQAGDHPARPYGPAAPGRAPAAAGPPSGRRGRSAPRSLPCWSAAAPRSARSAPGQVGTLGCLGSGFLIPVLPHIAHPELVQQPHIRRRKGLGDRDQRHLARIAPRRRTGRRDPLPDGRKPATQLTLPASAANCPSPVTAPSSRPPPRAASPAARRGRVAGPARRERRRGAGGPHPPAPRRPLISGSRARPARHPLRTRRCGGGWWRRRTPGPPRRCPGAAGRGSWAARGGGPPSASAARGGGPPFEAPARGEAAPLASAFRLAAATAPGRRSPRRRGAVPASVPAVTAP